MFRFRLIELLMAVVVFSLAALALAKPSPLAVSIVTTVVYLVVLAAAIVALAGVGPRRVFCLGFILGAVSYLGVLYFIGPGMLSSEYSSSPRLLTSRALALLYSSTKVITRSNAIPPSVSAPSPASSDDLFPGSTSDNVSSELAGITKAPAAPGPPPPVMDASTSSFGWDPYATDSFAPASTFYQPADARRIAFFDIGQQFWALAIGVFAGWAASIIYARRRPETAAA